MQHDKAVELLKNEYMAGQKFIYTNLFLSSLSGKNKNSALCTYALMRTYPTHIFLPYPHSLENINCNLRKVTPCYICSSYYELKDFQYGTFYDGISGFVRHDVYSMLDVLHTVNHMRQIPQPTDRDIQILIEILEALLMCDKNDTIRTVAKRLKTYTFFKAWVEEERTYRKMKRIAQRGAVDELSVRLQRVLETLGVCGILHTEKQKGAFFEYVTIGSPPRSSHNSDWYYPVDFWCGKDGVDWEAFQFWFGDYIWKEEWLPASKV